MNHLGQNFLINKNKIKEIVAALELKNGDTIIEIGPGHGEITKELVSRIQKLEARIIAVEKDERLAEKLRDKMDTYGYSVDIVTGDALKVLPVITKSYNLKAKSYKIVGNIPYYITGFLLRTIGELKNKPKLTVLTIQKEVAERIVAKPPRMNLLAASVQFWAEPKIVGIIPKTDFSPQPKVDSAIIRLGARGKRQATRDNKEETEKYYRLIKILFKQPRKTIINNLSQLLTNKREIELKLQKIGIEASDRPQNLSIDTIKKVGEVMYNEHHE